MANNNFDDKLGQIKRMLEDENIAKTLNGIIDSMSSSTQNETPPSTNNAATNEFPETEDFEATTQQASPPPRSTNSTIGDLGGSIDAFSKISQLYNEMSRTDSPSSNLLQAVKPYLNTSRQGRLDRASKILNLSKLPNMLRGFDRG